MSTTQFPLHSNHFELENNQHENRHSEDDSTNKLFSLLETNIDTKKRPLENDAIIEEVCQNPMSAAAMYEFSKSSNHPKSKKCLCYPLHRAIILGASIEVVEAIYESYPSAIQTQIEGFDANTALHLALQNKVSAEVTSFLLAKFPAAARATNKGGNVPLHDACIYGASLEIISLLLSCWPDSVKVKNSTGVTALHLAAWNFEYESIEVLSLLLNRWPQAASITDAYGNTPLHCACHERASLDVVLLLLEHAPESAKEKDNNGKTPLDIYEEKCQERQDLESWKGVISYIYNLSGYSKENDEFIEAERIRKVFSYIHQFCENSKDGAISTKEMMDYFIEIEWWNGVLLMLDEYPSLKRHMNIDTGVFPHFLSAVGRWRNTKLMWLVLSNELDMIEGV